MRNYPADFADKKDYQCLETIVHRLKKRLRRTITSQGGVIVKTVLSSLTVLGNPMRRKSASHTTKTNTIEPLPG